MRGLLRPSLLLLGTAAVLLGGGGVLAYATGWTSSTVSATFTVSAARMPQVHEPTVTMPTTTDTADEPAALPRITWRAVEITGGEPVHRYVVVRHARQATDVVCTLPATRATSCLDRTAPSGDVLTYTVTATHGAHWKSPDSDRSAPVTMPGPVTADPSPAPSVTPSATGSPAAAPPSAEVPSPPPPEPAATTTTAAPEPAPTLQATPEPAFGVPPSSAAADPQTLSSETDREPVS